MIANTSTNAQTFSNFEKKRNIKNQFYLTIGKGNLATQSEYRSVQYPILSGDLGGIFYLNKKKVKRIFCGVNWTAISTSIVDEQSALVGMQLGPELSFKLTKGVIFSLGHQYRYGAILEGVTSDPSISILYSSQSIHTTLKLGPLLAKVEYQFVDFTNNIDVSTNTIFNISLGLSI